MPTRPGPLIVFVVQNDIAANAPSANSAWAHAFALLYDPLVWAGERSGLRSERKALLSHARGRTLEIGAGTGLNMPHYPEDLNELLLAEPEPAMRARLEKRSSREHRQAQLIDAPAERLPFADETVDTVVSTLVLCTVEAPGPALGEIARVLRPDGQLLFIEHVRSGSAILAWLQDRLAGPWRLFAQGCRCNRATAELILACGLDLEHAEERSWHAMPPIVRPLVAGCARKTAGDGQKLSSSVCSLGQATS